MAKLTTVRITLIMLQLTSLIVASIIIIIYYNPWIGRIIDEAERSGNTGRSLADQIRRTDNEELVIFLMSSTTILVSLLGIIGALRNHEHNHCLLNFYMSTLIIFLFVVFVALCGTVWEVFGKLNQRTIIARATPTTIPSMTTTSTISLNESFQNNNNNNDDEKHHKTTTLNNDQYLNEFNQSPTIDFIDSSIKNLTNENRHNNNNDNNKNAQLILSSHHQVSWWYIGKSFMLITFSAIIYATSLKLTRKILESSDDHYLSANEFGGSHNNCGGGGGYLGADGDNDDLNSEDSCAAGIIGHTAIYPSLTGYPYTTTNSLRYPYYHQQQQQQQYPNSCPKHGSTIGSSKSSLGSQFRTIL
ncbi:hypothetical protein DERP_001568 [Dermatophagoides pteronyssinus]|uniref:Uncharacterized protein n=1 Tax=Dermatophagoides pteronyssinus TaxID=6956 RepID=A0ABQ8JAV9_DERPT|nr:hypothetical protein DERP_001568 [Dermatophagoides pteronyssinus]